MCNKLKIGYIYIKQGRIMKKLILFLIIITAIATSCKKYPDGPMFSLRTAKNRLYGYHTLTTYTVNGVDSLSHYYDSLSLNFHIYYEDVYGHDVCDMSGSRKDGWGSTLVWEWELKDKNKFFNIISSSGNYSTGPFGNNRCPEWEILKLKVNDIKMKTNYNGKEYLIELTN
jgi:hypothetical protein